MTYPLIFNLNRAVPNDIGDPLLNTWILAWDTHALLTDPLNLFNANIFYPLPNTLAYSEHLFSTALLALPLQLITAEPIVTYNLSLLLSFPLAAFGMYLLALRWTGSRAAAFIAGLIFGFAPYRFAAIAHLQLLTVQWLPFALLFLDLLLAPRRRPKLSLAAGLLVMLTGQVLASWYLAVYTGMIIAIYLVVSLAHARSIWWLTPSTGLRPHLPSPVFRLVLLGAVFLIAGLLILPLALPYLGLVAALAESRPLAQALTLAAVPTDYLAAAPFNTWFGPLTDPLRRRPFFSEENTLFLGLVAPSLAALGLIFGLRRHAATAFGAQTRISLIGLSGSLLVSLALTFAAPYAALAHLFPPSTLIRVPARWIIPVLFALAGLAAFGYTGLTRRLRLKRSVTARLQSSHLPALLLILTTLLLITEALHLPLPLAPIENRGQLNPAYAWLAAQPTDFALIELPLHAAPDPEYPEVKRLYASTLGWWPLINGYSGYTPPRQTELSQALKAFPDPTTIATLQAVISSNSQTARDVERGTWNVERRTSTPPLLQPSPLPLLQPSIPPSLQTSIPPTFHPSNLPTLLLLHPGEFPFDRTRWETVDRWQAERNPALWPLGQFDGDYLYQILPPDSTRFSQAALATFGPDRSIQLLAMNHGQLTKSHEPIHHSSFIIHHSSSPYLALYWRTPTPLTTTYTVFIHLRAADGYVIAQADGPPVSNHFPTTVWPPDEIIQDIHPLPEIDLSTIDHFAIGLYDPVTGERLPAYGPDGQRLVDEALVVPLN